MGIKTIVTGKGAVRVLVVLLMSALLFTTVAAPVYAGVEPSPFKALVNKLNSVVNVLEEIRMHVDAVLVLPPEPCLVVPPEPCHKGTVNMLNAKAHQLNILYDRIATLGPPPDDSKVREALMNVRDAAQAIVDDIRLGYPPDPCREAMGDVSDAAQAIVDLANRLLR
ncbi:MAG: hypothetical protein JSV54_03765 [Chloroflexota bacterium]|nr:MAG: hypothetical protein JSV54_03765 [Chloroflexota bacterium]